jgi:predicted nucleotidyltransferase
LIKKDNIVAFCAYGSRVAGYARKDSDYNIIIVTKDFKKEKSTQDKEPIQVLILEESVLRKEAGESSKEFVVGWFLNVYEPLIGADLFRSVELQYKKRIIAEELIEIQSEYGGFSSNLILPYEYFLFEKLHKRIKVYPEATYSIASTYTCVNTKENIEFPVRSFREAARSLDASGIIECTDESVRILPGEVRTNVLSKILTLLSPTKEGTSQPTGKGYEVLLGTGVVGSEIRARKTWAVKSPVELDRPKKLLRLEEGVVFDNASKINEELARISGFRGTYAFKEKKKWEVCTSGFSFSTRCSGLCVIVTIEERLLPDRSRHQEKQVGCDARAIPLLDAPIPTDEISFFLPPLLCHQQKQSAFGGTICKR